MRHSTMPAHKPSNTLPPIPDKRYFSIGEASQLCGVKTHVLRYWEQEFPQLKPSKHRGNRRAYRFQDMQLLRRIRELLYDQGYTISGARSKLAERKSTVVEEPITPIPAQQSVTQAAITLEKPAATDIPNPTIIKETLSELRQVLHTLES